ncbi:hypothetical protein COCC4DRAFT_31153, partial [Bipolaris maydis ATCC 48331]
KKTRMPPPTKFAIEFLRPLAVVKWITKMHCRNELRPGNNRYRNQEPRYAMLIANEKFG